MGVDLPPTIQLTIFRITRVEVKPQSKTLNVSLWKQVIEILVSQTLIGVLALHTPWQWKQINKSLFMNKRKRSSSFHFLNWFLLDNLLYLPFFFENLGSYIQQM